MNGNAGIAFKDYLRLRLSRAGDAPFVAEYEDFIQKTEALFALRAAAEDWFATHRYVAKSRQGALPLPWEAIRRVLEGGGPPENTLTEIAKHLFGVIETLSGNLRKVLARVRKMVGIGRVQQIDAHCLRWLVRQSGYTPVEKAGARQEILGVVRMENYDTLENRVLVDFLRRCHAQASIYLRRHGARWASHATVANVKQLGNLCEAILAMPECGRVKRLREFPMPNYVLRQDRLYSRVWAEYCKLVRQDDVAERLWARRGEVEAVHGRLVGAVGRHCSPNAKSATPLWFNELDERQDILEAPIWECPPGTEPIVAPQHPSEDEVVVDLAYPWDGRDEVVIPANHPNARPFIQNPHRPSLEPGRHVRLEEILESRDAELLAAYFHHLHGLIGGRKWVVLVPDHWDAAWLEKVIRARPPALASRSGMFLLWRSVAAAIGYQMQVRDLAIEESLLVEDGYCSGRFNAVAIRFKDDGTGKAIPQRASLRLHGEDAADGDVRFIVERATGDRSGLARLSRTGSFGWRFGCLCGNDDLLMAGAKECLRRMASGETPYYDELDAISLVVVNRAEEVEFKSLVAHKECWPGGRKYEKETPSAGVLRGGSRELLLYLAEGEAHDDSPLKEWKIQFGVATEKDAEITCRMEITPGQGLAAASFSASFLERPKSVDIGSAVPSAMTRLRIERELSRHFPPTMPLVEACPEIWRQIRGAVNAFMANGTPPSGDLFAQAQNYWGVVDPYAWQGSDARRYGHTRTFNAATMSPIDRLKRENVFGNAPGHRLPDAAREASFAQLFRALAARAMHAKWALRLLAWTYQFDNPALEPLRETLHAQYTIQGMPLGAVETSFCANNFDDSDPRVGQMLERALANLCNNASNENDLRLAYNLMQFHPSAISVCSTKLCEKAFNALVEAFNHYPFYVSQGCCSSAIRFNRLSRRTESNASARS